jgi:hypothetical protein
VPKPHTEVRVDKRPPCDICFERSIKEPLMAEYDGKTYRGTWAYMCHAHFKEYGMGVGLGRGQKLVIKK